MERQCIYHRHYRRRTTTGRQDKCDRKTTHETQLCHRHRQYRSQRAINNYIDASQVMPSRLTAYSAFYNNSMTNITEHELGDRMQCPKCDAFMWKDEATGPVDSDAPFQSCCERGRLANLERLPSPPYLIQELLTGRHQLSRHFLDHVRLYNSVMSFASFRAKEFPTNRSVTGGDYTFKIQGTVHHVMSTNQPSTIENAKFSQIFFFELQDQIQHRQSMFPVLNEDLLSQLHIAMTNNPYCEIYRRYGQQYDNATIMWLRAEPTGFGTNCAPGADEVAALLDTNDISNVQMSQIVVKKSNENGYRCISSDNMAYFPLVYSLIFTSGGAGHHKNLKDRNNDPVSMLQYYRYTYTHVYV